MADNTELINEYRKLVLRFLIERFQELLDEPGITDSAKYTLEASINLLTEVEKNPSMFFRSIVMGKHKGRRAVTICFGATSKATIGAKEGVLSCSEIGDVAFYPDKLLSHAHAEILYKMIQNLIDMHGAGRDK